MTTTIPILDTFTRAYIECALWSSTDNANDQGGEPLDANYGPKDIAPETLAKIVADCQQFQAENDFSDGWSTEQAGHDFWLTREGHGAGFWDRYSNGPLETLGRKLTDAAHTYGTFGLYIGDDGLIYAL